MKNADFVRSHLEIEAAKLAGASIKGQELRKIRFREALRVILDKKLMFTRTDIEKAYQRATQELASQGLIREIPGETFRRAFMDAIGS